MRGESCALGSKLDVHVLLSTIVNLHKSEKSVVFLS